MKKILLIALATFIYGFAAQASTYHCITEKSGLVSIGFVIAPTNVVTFEKYPAFAKTDVVFNQIFSGEGLQVGISTTGKTFLVIKPEFETDSDAGGTLRAGDRLGTTLGKFVEYSYVCKKTDI